MSEFKKGDRVWVFQQVPYPRLHIRWGGPGNLVRLEDASEWWEKATVLNRATDDPVCPTGDHLYRVALDGPKRLWLFKPRAVVASRHIRLLNALDLLAEVGR